MGFLLLLCCANTALLMLARVAGRRREFAVRCALGAGRGRLLRQVLIEAGLLAACGLALGIAVGWAGARSLVAIIVEIGRPPAVDIAPRAAILAFTGGVSVLAALASGLWPAWRASRADPAPDLKREAAAASLKRMGGWMVPAQVAVSMILLVAAALLAGTFLHFLYQPSGFRAGGVVLADFDLSLGAKRPTSDRARAGVKALVSALENTPGIEAATAMSDPPIDHWYSASHRFSIDARGIVRADLEIWSERVSPGYFAVMGTRILQGRPFDDADETGQRACLVSASAARNFFPGEDALGKYVYDGGDNPALDGKGKLDPKDGCRVVGIVEEARFQSLREAPPRMLYELLARTDVRPEFFLAVRCSKTGVAAAAIRAAAARIVPDAAQPEIFTFGALVDQDLSRERMLVVLSGGFAAIALVLSALGLYGLLARNVALRTGEIGVRVALGARPRSVLLMVSREGALLAAFGIVAGIAGALGLARFLRSLLADVRPVGPLLYLAVALFLALVALAACYVPARRAARIDPAAALRHE